MITQKQTAFCITSTAGLTKLERNGHDFMARHCDEISLRTSELTSAARARAFNQGAVNAFFNLLETVQDAKRFTPDHVYNVDETYPIDHLR